MDIRTEKYWTVHHKHREIFIDLKSFEIDEVVRVTVKVYAAWRLLSQKNPEIKSRIFVTPLQSLMLFYEVDELPIIEKTIRRELYGPVEDPLFRSNQGGEDRRCEGSYPSIEAIS